MMGATSARADLPDTLLDERERQLRGEVFRGAFILLMGMVGLTFAMLTLLEVFGIKLPRLEPQQLFALLFGVGFPPPTVVQAWSEPDPLE